MALGVLEHLEQHPELDAIGVRLDLGWRWRELVVCPPLLFGFAFRGAVRQLYVRIGDDRLLDVLVHRGAPLLVTALDLHGHLGPAGELPGDLLLLQNPRLVLLGRDLDFEVVRGRPRTGAGDDGDGLAGRELPVHAGRRDADALLPSAHAQPMKLGPIEQLREDPWNLLADDAGAIVGDRDPEATGLARRKRSFPTVGDGLHLDGHVREDSAFLAGIERVVYGLLDACEQRLARIVDPQEMPVLGEELGDGDLALASPHLDGGHRRRRRGGDGAGLRRGQLRAARCQELSRRLFIYPSYKHDFGAGTLGFPSPYLGSARRETCGPPTALSCRRPSEGSDDDGTEHRIRGESHGRPLARRHVPGAGGRRGAAGW